MKFDIDDEDFDTPDNDTMDEDADEEIVDNYHKIDDEDDYDEDKLTEESYRTTIEEDPESLSLEAAEIVEDDDY